MHEKTKKWNYIFLSKLRVSHTNDSIEVWLENSILNYKSKHIVPEDKLVRWVFHVSQNALVVSKVPT